MFCLRVPKSNGYLCKGIFVYILTLFLSLLLTGSLNAGGLRVAGPAPDFQLPDPNGGTKNLSYLKGKIVLVYFWADFCANCDKEFIKLDQVYRELKSANSDFEVLAINAGQPKSRIETFLAKAPVTFPILMDLGFTVTRKYGTRGMPTNYLVDKKGILREIIVGWIDHKNLKALVGKIRDEK